VSPDLARRAWLAASSVVDPEIPVLTIADLGVLRAVAETEAGDAVEVQITPTYSGCPAMALITMEIETALARAGISGTVRIVLAPAWTTDWMSEDGRRKLLDYGIAPPGPASNRRTLFGLTHVACPRCASPRTLQVAEFGSTSCKALWRCEDCNEPFDHFRCH
jgi:ring-1,2-phenylacetyl-CoA epoxidase subunit PaaD